MEKAEILINCAIFAFVWAIMFISDRLSRRAISTERVVRYRTKLNEIDRELKEKYGLNLARDAMEEIQRNRRDGRGLTLIFGGIFLGIAAIVLLIVEMMSVGNMMMAIVSAMWLVFYGLSCFTEHLKSFFLLLVLVFVVGIIVVVVLDQVLLISPSSFFFILLTLILYLLIRPRRRG